MFTTIPKQTFRAALSTFLFAASSLLAAHAQHNEETIMRLLSTPNTYSVYKTPEKIQIDGIPGEPAWQRTPWTDAFVDIEGDIRPTPLFDTRVKMLWDDHFLYIYAELEEPHLWATLDKHDQIIYHDNDFEIFIQNTEYENSYYEIEINALGTIFDLFMPATYRAGGKALTTWDIKGLQKAVHIAGSLNDPSDTDRFWAVEMAIPFTGISQFGRRPAPLPDDIWRINFSRVQWQHEIINGNYQRKTDENGKRLSEYNWVWSPQGIVDMHAPERWGYIRFEEKDPSATNAATFDIPDREQVKQKAWLIHYLQVTHKRLKGTYASAPQDLSQLYAEWEHMLADCRLELSAGKDWYVAKVYAEQENLCLAINQYGYLTRSSLDHN